MHPLGEKNKYIAMMFMKMSKEYWALGRDGIAKVSAEHARSLKPYNDMLTHVVCGSFDARYDQVTVVASRTRWSASTMPPTPSSSGRRAPISTSSLFGVKAPARGAAGRREATA